MKTEAIISGKLARNDKFPYHVFVKVNRRHCNGVVVHENFIVTAAHCVTKKGKVWKTKIYVIAGTNDLTDVSKNAELKIVTHVYLPKDFTPHEYLPFDKSDIAMLRV